ILVFIHRNPHRKSWQIDMSHQKGIAFFACGHRPNAKKKNAKKMHIFHFSHKYSGCSDLLIDEAEKAFQG
ncbi:MAG: hypothetical protein QGG87_02005, partial [Nitrospinota bacterium]|nr:hypothetical protein [Nitrospinota bacterium]